jgi:hypothetical protein
MGITVKLGGRLALIPPSEYRARVAEITEGSYMGKRKTFQFHFEIAEGPHQGVKLFGFVNAHYKTFTAHSKLHKWMAAISNGDMDSGAEVDLDIFYGKILIVKVETKESKKTKNHFSNITEILGVYFETE